jgi:hypothetical protein
MVLTRALPREQFRLKPSPIQAHLLLKATLASLSVPGTQISAKPVARLFQHLGPALCGRISASRRDRPVDVLWAKSAAESDPEAVILFGFARFGDHPCNAARVRRTSSLSGAAEPFR